MAFARYLPKHWKWLLVPLGTLVVALINALVRSSVEATVKEGNVNLSMWGGLIAASAWLAGNWIALLGWILAGALAIPMVLAYLDERPSTQPNDPKADSSTAVSTQKFHSAKDRENLADLCTELVGLLRKHGGDGGGTGAWKRLATLNNDWHAMDGGDASAVIRRLDTELSEARASIQSLWDDIYGDTASFEDTSHITTNWRSSFRHRNRSLTRFSGPSCR